MKVLQRILYREGCKTSRLYKNKKRQHLRAIRDSLNDLRYGSAYFPGRGVEIDEADEALKRLLKNLSVETWGN